MRLLALVLMMFPLVCGAADVDYLMINLMQPKELILEKTGNVDGLSRYIKQVEVDINKRLADVEAQPAWGFLVIAVREDGRIKAWVDTDDEVSAPVQNVMLDVAQGVRSFPVKSGAVVFAIGFGVGGAGLPPNTMPFPEVWKKAANCSNEDCADQSAEALALKTWQ